MTEPVSLDLVDRDAVLRRGGGNEGGLTRAEVFRRAALGGGALLGGGVLVTGVPAALAQSESDVAILNLALLVEYLETNFYTEAAEGGALSGRPLRFARQLAENEAGHRDALLEALGDEAIESPEFDFRGTTASQEAFLATALTLENNDVGAFNGGGPLLRSREILALAGQIVSVEGRQAAWIRRIVFGPEFAGGAEQYPAPVPFDPALTPDEVRAAVEATGFIRG